MSELPASAIVSAAPKPRASRAKRRGSRLPSAEEAGFPGCQAVPMNAGQLARMDEGKRIEYWDAEDGLAWMVREATFVHELPAPRLAVLLDRIAQARGAAIECCGSTTFYERGPKGDRIRAMEADQTTYLQAARPRAQQSPFVVLGHQAPPDLVLEVDHTTDVRRRKLREYQKWRFPEVWVEVPEEAAGRRSRRRPGTTIHVLDADTGCYREAAASRALPGWKAEEIHLALNEPKRSARTWAALERVGRALGKQEGTRPTEDPQLRRLLAEARSAGRREGLGSGLAQGREAATAAAVQAILRQRGIEHTPELLADGRLAALSAERAVAAALACDSEADLRERLSVPLPE